MWLHNFLCILISRSLPNLKEIYMTAFRHKPIHNSITQSKASISIMAANGGNVSHLRAIITSHTVCTFKMMYCAMHAAALQQLWICDSFDDCWFAQHWSITVFKMWRPRISKNCRSTFIFCSSWNLWGGPILACQGGAARTPAPPSVTLLLRTGASNSNCSESKMRTYKVTRGPHYDADATMLTPEPY